VTARIVRDQLKSTGTDFLKVTNDTVLVPITIQISNGQLSFQSKEGIHSATLNILAALTLTGRVVQTFEDPVAKDFPIPCSSSRLNCSRSIKKPFHSAPGCIGWT
jgi:hypothetical protein